MYDFQCDDVVYTEHSFEWRILNKNTTLFLLFSSICVWNIQFKGDFISDRIIRLLYSHKYPEYLSLCYLVILCRYIHNMMPGKFTFVIQFVQLLEFCLFHAAKSAVLSVILTKVVEYNCFYPSWLSLALSQLVSSRCPFPFNQNI